MKREIAPIREVSWRRVRHKASLRFFVALLPLLSMVGCVRAAGLHRVQTNDEVVETSQQVEELAGPDAYQILAKAPGDALDIQTTSTPQCVTKVTTTDTMQRVTVRTLPQGYMATTLGFAVATGSLGAGMLAGARARRAPGDLSQIPPSSRELWTDRLAIAGVASVAISGVLLTNALVDGISSRDTVSPLPYRATTAVSTPAVCGEPDATATSVFVSRGGVKVIEARTDFQTAALDVPLSDHRLREAPYSDPFATVGCDLCGDDVVEIRLDAEQAWEFVKASNTVESYRAFASLHAEVAPALIEAACEASRPMACLSMVSPAPDAPIATIEQNVDYVLKACEAGYDPACLLGVDQRLVLGAWTPAIGARIDAIVKPRCARELNKLAPACVRLALNEAYAQCASKKRRVRVEGCMAAGRSWSRIQRQQPEHPLTPSIKLREREYFERGCESGDADGCALAAGLYEEDGRPQDLILARTLYIRTISLEKHHLLGLAGLGRLAYKGLGGPRDVKLGLALYQNLCTHHKMGVLCNGHAMLLYDSGDAQGAMRAAKRGCDAGLEKSCSLFGLMVKCGQGDRNACLIFQGAHEQFMADF